MALQSLHHIPLWAVVAMPLIAARLQAQVPALRRSLSDWRRPALLAVSWPLLALSVVCLTMAGADWDDLQPGREPGSRTYPAGAVEYIRTHQLDGNLFHAYDWGGYLIYQLYPEQRVFVDGRADPYGDELMERYMEVALLRPGWRQVLDDYDVRLVLVEKDSVAGSRAGRRPRLARGLRRPRRAAVCAARSARHHGGALMKQVELNRAWTSIWRRSASRGPSLPLVLPSMARPANASGLPFALTSICP
jgi:hypothetical protein